MNKKGFTLIELLAVIVILAIIALIATPAVLNIIEDSKKGAAEASARNIISAAKNYYMQSTMNGSTIDEIDLSTNTLKYDGDQATKGNIIFTNGKASGTIYVSGYCVEISLDGKVTSEKKAEDECGRDDVIVTPPMETYTKYNDGTPLLYDPVNNVKCIATEVETNVNTYKSNHIVDNNENFPTISGLKDGCMKWYAFLDSEESSTVNLILDHNTTGYSAYANDGETTPTLANAQLQRDITNWNSDVKVTARLISASEVRQIAPTASDFTWTQNDYTTWYYLHDGNKTTYMGDAGTNKYAWLFDNTESCPDWGCYNNDYGTCGYWTSDFASNNKAWLVFADGRMASYTITDDEDNGIRPVITVDKSIFE